MDTILITATYRENGTSILTWKHDLNCTSHASQIACSQRSQKVYTKLRSFVDQRNPLPPTAFSAWRLFSATWRSWPSNLYTVVTGIRLPTAGIENGRPNFSSGCFISSLLQLIVVVAFLLLAQYVMETSASQKLETAARPAKQQLAGCSGSPFSRMLRVAVSWTWSRPRMRPTSSKLQRSCRTLPHSDTTIYIHQLLTLAHRGTEA
jgi:hypothetical protein